MRISVHRHCRLCAHERGHWTGNSFMDVWRWLLHQGACDPNCALVMQGTMKFGFDQTQHSQKVWSHRSIHFLGLFWATPSICISAIHWTLPNTTEKFNNFSLLHFFDLICISYSNSVHAQSLLKKLYRYSPTCTYLWPWSHYFLQKTWMQLAC